MKYLSNNCNFHILHESRNVGSRFIWLKILFKGSVFFFSARVKCTLHSVQSLYTYCVKFVHNYTLNHQYKFCLNTGCFDFKNLHNFLYWFSLKILLKFGRKTLCSRTSKNNILNNQFFAIKCLFCWKFGFSIFAEFLS